MALSGEIQAMLAWWLVIVLLLPILMLAFKTNYIALKTVCLLAFSTQFISTPFFYFNKDNFSFGNIHPFDFAAIEAWPMLSKVAVFMFLFVVFFKLLYGSWLLKGASKILTDKFISPPEKSLRNELSVNLTRFTPQRKRRWFYIILILFLIGITSTLKLWMFSNAIALTGVEPPRLPFRLSGILFYLTLFIMPILLIYLYWKVGRSGRTFFLMMVLVCFALLNGLTSVSKGAVLVIIAPAIFFAWYDRRHLQLVVAVLAALIGVSMAAASRSFVYVVSDNKSSADVSMSIISLASDVINDPNREMFKSDFFIQVFLGIVDRVEGFSNLVMSSNYDINAVMQPYGFLLNIIWPGFMALNGDAHHMQWQGYVLPEGFYNGGALLSNVVILGNESLFWVVAAAFVVAAILVVMEKSVHYAFFKYGLSDLLAIPIIGFLTFWFFTAGGISMPFLGPLILFILLSTFPRMYKLNRKSFSK